MPRRFSLLLTLLLAPPVAAQPTDAEFFEAKVRPILAEKCQGCHGAKKQKGGLRLDGRAAVLAGGDTGPAAVDRKPADSLLVKAVKHSGELKMPPDKPLTDAEVKQLEEWVRRGLPWSADTAPTAGTGIDLEAARRYWAFQPVKPVPPPPVKDSAWVKSPIDHFILASLEAKSLRPAKPADKRALVRRVTFDLTGLPPTPEEVEAFVADPSPDAYAKLIDRLLASPAYGERWARHWLDVVRYADSFDARGIGGEMDVPAIWRYRDWVVKSLNADLPYDQFVRHQIAGDLLPEGQRLDGIVATGMLAIGNWGGGDADKEKLLTDIADDQVDVVGRAFLGLTLGCARCHDHKFDPITTEDYYALAGVFFSSHILANPGPKTNGPPMLRVPLLTAAEESARQAKQARLTEVSNQVRGLTNDRAAAAAREAVGKAGVYLRTARAVRDKPGEVEALARKDGLNPAVLRRCVELIAPPDFRHLRIEQRAVQGKPGLFALQGSGPGGSPNLLVNTTADEVKFLTITLPPRSVSVHPSPSGGVAVAWKAPAAGPVKVTGRVADADGVCGNGIEWAVEKRAGGANQSLATGAIPNGGSTPVAGPKLAEVVVAAGDELLLVVLPKGDYSCDTTVVEFEVTEVGGERRTWNLTRELLAGPADAVLTNPRPDRFGHPAVWHYGDVGGTKPAVPGGPDSPLDKWVEAVRRRAAEDELGRLVGALDKALADRQSKLFRDLTTAASPFAPTTAEVEAGLTAGERDRLKALRAAEAALRKELAAEVPFAHGCLEGGCPQSPQAGVHDVKVHVRGRYDRLGKLVPRRFPMVIAGENQRPITSGSGRKELADWIASPANPLTARVIVNRLWQHHFGEGLVRTPGNFGQLGERPTHPELLDWLADRLVKSGWSLKALHRDVLLSATYRQSSRPDPATLAADPDNRLLGRVARRRLDAEEIRDALLAVAGTLDRTAGGKAVRDISVPRRSLYLMTVRSDRTTFRELFDAADPTAIIDRRSESTVAPQALFLLNHPFAKAQVKALAERAAKVEQDRRIDWLYRTLYARPPSAKEAEVGRVAVERLGWEGYVQVLVCANEFVYVD